MADERLRALERELARQGLHGYRVLPPLHPRCAAEGHRFETQTSLGTRELQDVVVIRICIYCVEAETGRAGGDEYPVEAPELLRFDNGHVALREEERQVCDEPWELPRRANRFRMAFGYRALCGHWHEPLLKFLHRTAHQPDRPCGSCQRASLKRVAEARANTPAMWAALCERVRKLDERVPAGSAP